MTNKKNIVYLFSFLYDKELRIRVLLFSSLILCLIYIFLNIFTPFFLKRIADQYPDMTSENFILTFMWLSLSYSFLWTITQVTSSIRDYCMYQVLERGIRSFTSTLMNHLNGLSYAFYSATNIGFLTNAFERIHNTYHEVIWGLMFSVFPSFTTILIASGLIFHLYGFKYACIMLILLCVYTIFSFVCTQHATFLQKESNKKYKELISYIVDTLMNFELIKYFCNQEYEKKNLSKILSEREKTKTAALLYSEKIRAGQWIIIGCFFALMNFLFSQEMEEKKFTVGDFILINSYILQFFSPLSNLGITFRNIRKGMTDLDDLMELLNIEPHAEINPRHTIIGEIESYSIEFKNVKFGYESHSLILNNLSFDLSSKKTLAIIGSSGSGKTTIAKLLFRLYNAQEGHIFIGGKEISQVNLFSLQSIIAIVPQEPCIFHQSIRYNIAYGNPTASFNEIREMAKLANIDAFIMSLPQKYDTLVGPRGLNLSGGEKQRIAIARALLKNPKIMIFDEATSALDKENERVIQKNIYELAKGFTSIVITHRPNIAMLADEILVLKDGEVNAKGTHEELFQFNIYYQQLWKNHMEKS